MVGSTAATTAMALAVMGGIATTAYAIGRYTERPLVTEIGHAGCAGSDRSVLMGAPLAAFELPSPVVPLRIGPVRLATEGPDVALEFDPAMDGARDSVRLDAGVLRLPLTLDAKGTIPALVTLTCRNGNVERVAYRGSGGQNRTYAVAVATVDAAAEPSTP